MPPARKRRSRNQSPSTSEIVAPGGGTQADVDKLAKNLGMESNSVSAILNSEGSGVASARRSRSSGADATESAPVAASSAWADFMTDDDGLDKDSSKDTAQQADEGTVAKRAKTADIDIALKSEVTGEGYVLPIAFKEAKPGVLAQTGSLDAKMVGRIKRPLVEIFDLQEPTLLGYESIFDKQLVSVIATSSSACHSIVITADGSAYSWGRNESGQCGFGETSACVPVPKKIEHGSKFVAAAVGKSHSILVADDGVCYAVGLNKYGQCGVNSSIEAILGWKKCVFSGATGAKIVQVRTVSSD
jgi:hypothetical protein